HALLQVETVAAGGGDRVACRPGCSSCCRVNVSVLAPEAALIALHPAAAAVREGVRETALKVRWMEDPERIRRGIACPFLDAGGNCSVYPVRPLLCRSVTSTDAEACREAFATYDEEGGMVEVDLLQKFLYDQAFVALGEALAAGGEGRSVELCAAVDLFIRDPQLPFTPGFRFPR
ncbi:MAG TPA: YkgJ family cysteine cluster protein, partial [Verrucomicrobiae bacterium]|nr:YkgJ family cysteine cluster protein [Verrucomicrobiae bacterium]